MKSTTEDVLARIKKEISMKGKRGTVILFGSTARGEDSAESDIDLCVICNKGEKRIISRKLMGIEKEYDRNIQVVFTDKEFSGLDHTFVETLLREGIPLIGQIPKIPIERLKLDPYRLIRYEIKSLSKSEKMRLRRLLYGLETKKRYKKKVYINKQRGLLDITGGIRTGIASIIVPEKEAGKIVKLLRDNGAVVQSFPVWMSGI